jgi:hypothetical protein
MRMSLARMNLPLGLMMILTHPQMLWNAKRLAELLVHFSRQDSQLHNTFHIFSQFLCLFFSGRSFQLQSSKWHARCPSRCQGSHELRRRMVLCDRFEVLGKLGEGAWGKFPYAPIPPLSWLKASGI